MNFLSPGGIKAALAGEKNVFNVQILHIKGIAGPSGGAPVRFKVVVTDGVDSVAVVCASQLNSQLQDGTYKNFSVVKITQFQSSPIQGNTVLIIVGMELVTNMDKQIPDHFIELDGYKTAGGGAPAPVQVAPAAVPSSVYYQQHQQQQYQPPVAPPVNNPYAHNPYGTGTGSAVNNSKPVMRMDSGISENIVPIAAINPYSSRCTIKARVTLKSDMRHWSNAKGTGSLFSVDLLDAQGGEIRGTFFKEACEKFYPVIAEGKVFTFTGFKAKLVTNKNFSSIKNNYEITFDISSDIRAANDDTDIKQQHYAFSSISSLPQIEPNQTVDIIAIVRGASEVTEIVSQKMGGKTLTKRELTLVDESLNDIRMTLWGEKAQQDVDWNLSPIVAFKGVRVGDYGGRSLSMSQSSAMAINPDLPEALQLHRWRQSNGGVIPTGVSLSAGGSGDGGPSVSFDDRRVISNIKDHRMGGGEKADYITLKGTVSYIKHDNDPWYCACPSENCNKKVTESMNGQWNCEKCNYTYAECQRRYILSLVLSDASGNNWFSLFNDTAEMLLQASAESVYQMKSQGDELGAASIFKNALFKTFVAKVRVKQELVQDEMRVKSTIVSLNEIDYIAESRSMLAAIDKYQ